MYQSTAVRSLASAWKKALAANHTGSFPTVNPDFAQANPGPPRITVATGQALIDYGNQLVPSEIHLVLFGAGSDGNTMKARLWGFRSAVGGYIGTLLWAGTGTLSAKAGTAGFAVTDTDLFCDAIATTIGTESVDCRTTSPSGDIPAKVVIRTAGCELLVLEFDKDASTSANALYAGE